ncbi:uncharacterized protein LOC135693179 [Rhopilema esculentum]|uniref:uncharacterized protein LOC135693179 n=1 Tax=Rhopilema esculentum TaxID=499914 RepID=UPI0031CFF9AB
MDDMETDAACAMLIVCALRMKRKKIRKVWCKEWLQKREDTSLHTGLVSKLRLADREDYRRFMRMNTTTFEELLFKVRPYNEGQTTHMRQPISAEEKLAVTLRFLATGETYQSLKYQFRIHNSTISLFVPKVCQVIYDVLKDDYFSVPSSEQEWINLADATEKRWQFPNAFAAADGKHIAVYHPDNSGGTFYNYKGFYSIVLLAFVDYDYKFIYADVGCQGRISDGGVYRNSSFSEKLSAIELNLPPARPLPRSRNPAWTPYENEEDIPFVFVADSAFSLSKHCMKPYAEKGCDDKRRIFNYRLRD